MTTPIEFQTGLTVGVIDAVAPDALEITILEDSPHGTALNAGVIQQFPTINGHVSVPTEVGSILGIVTWIGVDHDRPHRADADVVRLAVPRRRMRVVPLGVLKPDAGGALRLERGVPLFPTVGDPVLLPTPAELRAIYRAAQGLPIRIGRAVTGARATIEVDPNQLFGGHLAVLGNTGSGKSCTVVHIVRAAALS